MRRATNRDPDMLADDNPSQVGLPQLAVDTGRDLAPGLIEQASLEVSEVAKLGPTGGLPSTDPLARHGQTPSAVITMDYFRGGELTRILIMEKRTAWADRSEPGSWLFR